MSVLCGEGVFSCLCLPLHQAHVVIVGTAEGCLLLWDLQGPASVHLAAVRQHQGFVGGGLSVGTRSGGAFRRRRWALQTEAGLRS